MHHGWRTANPSPPVRVLLQPPRPAAGCNPQLPPEVAMYLPFPEQSEHSLIDRLLLIKCDGVACTLLKVYLTLSDSTERGLDVRPNILLGQIVGLTEAWATASLTKNPAVPLCPPRNNGSARTHLN